MKPTSTSTPKRVPQKRSGIHSFISPLSTSEKPTTLTGREIEQDPYDAVQYSRENVNVEKYKRADYTDDSDSSADEGDNAEESDSSQHHVIDDDQKLSEIVNQHPGNVVFLSACIAVILALASIVTWKFFIDAKDTEECSINVRITDLQSNFPSQSKELWMHLQSGLSDINTFNKPCVYIFLYEKGSESTLDALLKNISIYATRMLSNDCEVAPIELHGEQLNSTELVGDYGKIIEKYKPQLEARRIMVINNLDKVAGNVAQALHSFCDEVTPLVNKSLFLFTIKVDEFQEKDLLQVVNILRDKWKDLDGDKLEPLLTRLSNSVLRITSEVKFDK